MYGTAYRPSLLGPILLSVWLLLPSALGWSQEAKRLSNPEEALLRADDFFVKEKYSQARRDYSELAQAPLVHELNHPEKLLVEYRHAISALRLYHPDAIQLLEEFLAHHPESVYVQSALLELADHYFYKKKYEDVLHHLQRLDPSDLDSTGKSKYYYQLGYSQYREDQLDAAKLSLNTGSNFKGPFTEPSIFYYGYILYMQGHLQGALEAFRRLETDQRFADRLPEFIVQILHRQKDYKSVTDYADHLSDTIELEEPDQMNLLIADAHFQQQDYASALIYFERVDRKAFQRDHTYQLGYSYYRNGNYEKAIPQLGRAAQGQDSLAQSAWVQLARSYEALEKKEEASAAYLEASKMGLDAKLEEEALFRHAVLSFEQDYNPFNNAQEALNIFLQTYPNSKHAEEARDYLVHVYTQNRDYAKTMQVIDQMQDKSPKVRSAYQVAAFNLATQLYFQGKTNDSYQVFGSVQRYPVNPRLNAESKYWMAEILHKQKRYTESIEMYRSFESEPGARQTPYYELVWYNIGYVYYEQDDYTSAEQAFRSFEQDARKHPEELQDARLRIGDCFHMQKNNAKANTYYSKAIQAGGKGVDYAMYQKALVLGFEKKLGEKASLLEDFLKKYPKSTYHVNGLFEAADAYRLQDQLTKALKYYERILTDHPSHPLVRKALIEMGGIYQEQQNWSKAKDMYLRALRDYNDPDTQRAALARLKEVYAALNDLDSYFALAEKYGMDPVDDNEKEELFYTQAYKQFIDSNFNQCIAQMRDYMSRYPAGGHKTEALYYIAWSHKAMGDDEGALKAFYELAQLPDGDYSEEALLAVSRAEYNEGNYTEALGYYARLKGLAKNATNRKASTIGLMRCGFYVEDWDLALQNALILLQDDELARELKKEATFIAGKGYKKNGDLDSAKPLLEEAIKLNDGVFEIESLYMLADIEHLDGDYKASEKTIRKLLGTKPGFRYWSAKALILQAKNLIEVEDYFQAEHTLNSVLKGYKGDDDVLPEARSVMEVLEQRKAAQASGSIEDGGTDNEEGDDE